MKNILELQKKNFVITDKNVEQYADKIATWISQQVQATHSEGVVLGMSGGIDCSVVARLCQLAQVDIELVLMPYGDDMEKTSSYSHSMELINKFKFLHHSYDIKPAVDALAISGDSWHVGNKLKLDLARANIRPRVRMAYLYEYAQLNNFLVIGTGNLFERMIGYFTKWGDGGCDLNPIGMLTKREVYVLASYLRIPNSIIQKKPSAGLWEGQTDEDEIGMTYAQIDDYLLYGTSGNIEINQMIERKIKFANHKLVPIPIFLDCA